MNTCMDVNMGKEADIAEKYLDVRGHVRRLEAGLSGRKEPEMSASETEQAIKVTYIKLLESSLY